MNDVQYVTVIDLAKKLGIDRSNALKMVKAMGLPTVKVRNAKSRMQAMSALSQQDADRVIAERVKNGFPLGKGEAKPVIDQSAREYLFVMRPDPSVRPYRIAISNSTSVDGVLELHKTLCPDISILRVWTAPKTCEEYLNSLADDMGIRKGPKVFDMGNSLSEFLSIADAALKKWSVPALSAA